MRKRKASPPHHGSVFLLTLLTLTGLITYSMVDLQLSMSEISTATRSVNKAQAFHLAEAGLDDSLTQLRTSTPAALTAMLSSLPAALPCALSGCTVSLADDVPGSTQDTNGIVVLTVTGTAAGIPQRVQATLQVTTGGAGPSVFDYIGAGTVVSLGGNTSIGDLTNSTGHIYAEGPPGTNGTLTTTTSDNVWVSRIDFVNPTNALLGDLCKNCWNQTIFHGPPIFNTNASTLPVLQFDLKPYYIEAVKEGAGHVISADATWQNQTLTGVYYVEYGVIINVQGTVTVNGTIVYEGGNWGKINLASNATLTVDSTAGLTPFAPGLAIIGVPSISTMKNSIMNTTGFVMMSGVRGMIKSNGTIQGGVIAVADAWIPYPDLVNNPGPGSYSAIAFPLSTLTVSAAHLIFQPLPPGTPGLPSGGVSVTMLSWTKS